jgi:predicted outer membrane repeat protein
MAIPRIVNSTVDLGAYEYNGLDCPSYTYGRVYVNAAAATGGNGKSWSTPFRYLQDALNVACTCGNVKDIWVAQGTYYPDEGVGITNNYRDTSFVLCDGVKLYGGFSGTETMLSQRNWRTNISTLSGDLMQNDGPNFANNAENAHHVVVAAFADATPTTHLDGFTITGGNANGSEFVMINGQNIFRETGGGIYTFFGTNTMTNNTISGNSASGGGGGIRTLRGTNTMTNNTISGNIASYGGGIYTFFGTNTMTNNTISGNSASVDGGGIYTEEGTNTLDQQYHFWQCC